MGGSNTHGHRAARCSTTRRPGQLRRAVLGAIVVLAGLGALSDPAAAQSDLDAVAAANGRSRAQMSEILDDPSARVGPSGKVYFVDPAPTTPPPSRDRARASAPQPAAPFPYAQTFLLHSRPGSQRVVHLDFDGATVSGTAWNNDPGLGTPASFVAEPFSIDEAPGFSDAERDVIQSVWQRVSEDFAVFDVDVTTQDPGQAAITRSGSGDQLYGTRALITNTNQIYDSCTCGGIAYLGVFNEPSEHARFQPAFIFNRSYGGDPKGLADTASHEVGHNFDLSHDGSTTNPSYYAGHGAWAPLMGSSYPRPISQWSRGEYAGATNTEDDLAVIQANGAALLADDHGSTAAAATTLPAGQAVNATGVITTDADVDVFRVSATAGAATFSVAPAPESPNLDVLLEVRTAAGALLASANPPSGAFSYDAATGMAASVSLTLPTAGDYLLSVSGVGTGNPSTGYSGYGSIGRYTLTDTALPGPTVTLVASPATVLVGGSSTLTATSSIDVGPTPYFIQILEGGAVRQQCGTGTSCSITLTYPAAGTSTYTARLSASDGSNVQATSASVSVTASASTAVTLSTSASAVTVGQSATLTASSNVDVGPTPYFIQILEGGVVRQECGTGTLCSATVSYPAVGTFTYTARVSASDGSNVQATSGSVTVTVRQAPAFTAASPPTTATLGAPFGPYTFFASGSPAPTFSLASGSLPAGLGLSAAGVLSGTPTGAGSSTFTVRAANGVGAGATTAAITITVSAPPVASTFTPLSPFRVWDTRVGPGPTGRVGPNGTRDVSVTGTGDVPSAGVTAVVLNVTAVNPSAGTFVTAWPTGEPRPLASNLNIPAGDTRPNLVTVKVGAGGRVSVANDAGTVDLVADVSGWYGPSGAERYTAVSPARIFDSRFGPGSTGRITAGSPRAVTVVGAGGVPPAGATAVVLNVTAVNPSAGTFVTVWPAGEARPVASNLNIPPGDTRANLVVVKVGAGGQVSMANDAGAIDLIADVAGWFGPSGAALTSVSPSRVWDSRGEPGPTGRIGAGATREIVVTGAGGVPVSGVTAVVLNVTAVNPSAGTFVTVWPTGESRPVASNLNVPRGDTRANLVVVKVGAGGRVSFGNDAGTVDLIADVAGWYGASGP